VKYYTKIEFTGGRGGKAAQSPKSNVQEGRLVQRSRFKVQRERIVQGPTSNGKGRFEVWCLKFEVEIWDLEHGTWNLRRGSAERIEIIRHAEKCGRLTP